MAKLIHVFTMTKNYTRLEVWHCVITPDKGLTRKQRRDVLAKELFQRFNIRGAANKFDAGYSSIEFRNFIRGEHV